ncbi:hypothetical protein J4731_19730 [Providencia rettgeri]|nr:hypothetical protein [Providencia rettgeri]
MNILIAKPQKNNEQIEGEEQQYDNRQDDEQSFSEKLAELNQKPTIRKGASDLVF